MNRFAVACTVVALLISVVFGASPTSGRFCISVAGVGFLYKDSSSSTLGGGRSDCDPYGGVFELRQDNASSPWFTLYNPLFDQYATLTSSSQSYSTVNSSDTAWFRWGGVSGKCLWGGRLLSNGAYLNLSSSSTASLFPVQSNSTCTQFETSAPTQPNATFASHPSNGSFCFENLGVSSSYKYFAQYKSGSSTYTSLRSSCDLGGGPWKMIPIAGKDTFYIRNSFTNYAYYITTSCSSCVYTSSSNPSVNYGWQWVNGCLYNPYYKRFFYASSSPGRTSYLSQCTKVNLTTAPMPASKGTRSGYFCLMSQNYARYAYFSSSTTATPYDTSACSSTGTSTTRWLLSPKSGSTSDFYIKNAYSGTYLAMYSSSSFRSGVTSTSTSGTVWRWHSTTTGNALAWPASCLYNTYSGYYLRSYSTSFSATTSSSSCSFMYLQSISAPPPTVAPNLISGYACLREDQSSRYLSVWNGIGSSTTCTGGAQVYLYPYSTSSGTFCIRAAPSSSTYYLRAPSSTGSTWRLMSYCSYSSSGRFQWVNGDRLRDTWYNRYVYSAGSGDNLYWYSGSLSSRSWTTTTTSYLASPMTNSPNMIATNSPPVYTSTPYFYTSSPGSLHTSSTYMCLKMGSYYLRASSSSSGSPYLTTSCLLHSSSSTDRRTKWLVSSYGGSSTRICIYNDYWKKYLVPYSSSSSSTSLLTSGSSCSGLSVWKWDSGYYCIHTDAGTRRLYRSGSSLSLSQSLCSQVSINSGSSNSYTFSPGSYTWSPGSVYTLSPSYTWSPSNYYTLSPSSYVPTGTSGSSYVCFQFGSYYLAASSSSTGYAYGVSSCSETSSSRYKWLVTNYISNRRVCLYNQYRLRYLEAADSNTRTTTTATSCSGGAVWQWDTSYTCLTNYASGRKLYRSSSTFSLSSSFCTSGSLLTGGAANGGSGGSSGGYSGGSAFRMKTQEDGGSVGAIMGSMVGGFVAVGIVGGLGFFLTKGRPADGLTGGA